MSTPVGYIPRYEVSAPPVAPRPFGLLSVAVEGAGSPAAGPSPWERGVDYYSPLCDSRTGSLEGFCPESDETEKELTPFAPVRVEGGPFTVTSGTICTAPTFDAENEAEAQLNRGEAFRVEDRFFRHKADSTEMVDLGEAPDVVCAIGALEAYAARHYGGRPILHVPVILMPMLFRDQLARVDGDRLVTQWGTPIAVGAGYPQDTPTPILITGVVTMWRTEVFVNSDFNVRRNQRLAIAERTYVLTADCLAAGIVVPGCPGGEETP